jgi:plastocyanin
MRNGVLAALAVIGSLAVLWVMMLGAMATYDAVADDDMSDQMWEMMGDMEDMNGMMDGMMGDRDDGPVTTGSASGRGEVAINDFRFEPTVLHVTPGTVILWTNEDGAPHTATARDGSFDTGRLGRGESGQVTLEEPGTFEYVCSYHPSMEGRVVVADGQTPSG